MEIVLGLILLLSLPYPFVELFGFLVLLQALAAPVTHKNNPFASSGAKRLTVGLSVVLYPSVYFGLYLLFCLSDCHQDQAYLHYIAMGLWGVSSFIVFSLFSHLTDSHVKLFRGCLSALAMAVISLCYALHSKQEYGGLALIPLAAAVNQLLCFFFLRKCWLVSHKQRNGSDGTPFFQCKKGALPLDDAQRGDFHKRPPAGKERTMNANRVILIVVILLAVSAAWTVLGHTISHRTEQLDESNSAEIASLWGPKVLTQIGPYWSHDGKRRNNTERLVPQASTVNTNISHTNRYKGLLWFSTFTVDFDATYVFSPDQTETRRDGVFCFPLPRNARGYDRMVIDVDGQNVPVSVEQIAAGVIHVPMSLEQQHRIHVHYATGGQDVWIYSPAGDVKEKTVDTEASADRKQMYGRGAGQDTIFTPDNPPISLPEFQLTVSTNFDEIDYPRGTASPSTPARETDDGMCATWQYANAVRSQAMGVTMPQRTNAGPIAARMSYYAPVSLLLFVAVFLTLMVRKGFTLHPMHFAFIAAGFFAFQILLAYLADIINIHLAFWISAIVSVVLVVSYMRLVAGMRFAVLYAGGAQLVYLVGFSYAFFWVGRTGLTVTILSIITLFIMMQATGRIDWQKVFNRSRTTQPPINANTTPLPPIPSQE